MIVSNVKTKISTKTQTNIPTKTSKTVNKVRLPFFITAHRTTENLQDKHVPFKITIKEVYIFFLALKHQLWRRCFYISHKSEVLQSSKTRGGECKRCGGCCKSTLKCPNLDYDENGLSCCKINHNKPRLCALYPYNRKDFFKHLQDRCGYTYEIKRNYGMEELRN
ncbi:MAG: YkgJ family cysteine cluster protein [Candidatus Anammoxibacter sp.]